MKVEERARVEVTISISLNESEMRALDALVGYGDDAFLKVFYEKLGKAYMQPHEAGLRSLFSGVRETIPAVLSRAKKAREVFEKAGAR